MFLSIRIGICPPWAFTISTIVLTWDGDFLLRSYMVSNNLVVYTWYIPEYAWYMSGLYWFWFYCWVTEPEMMKLQPHLRTGMYRSLLRLGTSHRHRKSMFFALERNARYNPGIYLSYLLSSNLAGLVILPITRGCFCLLILWDRKASNSRLGPAKVPQPVVDLINMAAPTSAWCRAFTVCTPECEGLLLLHSELVLNGIGGDAIKEARKEWHLSKEVLNPANVQSRDRWGFIQLPIIIKFLTPFDSIVPVVRRRRSSKALKKTRSRGIFLTTIIAITFACVQGTQSTAEEELWSYNPHAVGVRNGRCNVIMSAMVANLVRIGGDYCQTVLWNIYQKYVIYIHIIWQVYTWNIPYIFQKNARIFL